MLDIVLPFTRFFKKHQQPKVKAALLPFCDMIEGTRSALSKKPTNLALLDNLLNCHNLEPSDIIEISLQQVIDLSDAVHTCDDMLALYTKDRVTKYTRFANYQDLTLKLEEEHLRQDPTRHTPIDYYDREPIHKLWSSFDSENEHPALSLFIPCSDACGARQYLREYTVNDHKTSSIVTIGLDIHTDSQCIEILEIYLTCVWHDHPFQEVLLPLIHLMHSGVWISAVKHSDSLILIKA